MGYSNASGEHRGELKRFKASAAETATSTHSTVDADEAASAVITVDVTAASGTTPTLLVTVEGSIDNGSTWFTVGKIGSNGALVGAVGTAPANFSTTGTVSGAFPAVELMRTKSTVGGTTPSFTYSVVAALA